MEDTYNYRKFHFKRIHKIGFVFSFAPYPIQTYWINTLILFPVICEIVVTRVKEQKWKSEKLIVNDPTEYGKNRHAKKQIFDLIKSRVLWCKDIVNHEGYDQ